MDEMDQIVKEFLVESNEGLDQMDRDLVELEKNPAEPELLARIFRAIHTVKGTSGVLGYPKLEKVAHAGENLLSRMRDGALVLTPDITSGLLMMLDAIRTILRDIEQTGNEGERDYTPVSAALGELLRNEIAAQLPETQDEAVAVAPRSRVGEILVESQAATPAAVDAALQKQVRGDARRLGQILVGNGDVQPKAVLRALAQQVESPPSITASNIRVDVSLLDKLMNLVGELV